MYRVTKGFFDMQDGERWYTEGEEYPRAGYKPTESRLAELLSGRNAQHVPLIVEVEEPKPKTEPKPEPKKATKKVKK